MLRDLAPFPIQTAPGFEDFAETLLDSDAAEDIVWTPAGGDPVPLRAIARFGVQSLKGFGGTSMTWNPIRMIMVSAQQVQGILPGDMIAARGGDFQVAQGGVHPDGVAMVRVDLKEVS